MKSKLVCLLTIIIIFFTGCVYRDYALPIYSMTNGDEGICVTINNVIYTEIPSKWVVHYSNKVMGYAGSRDMAIIEAKGDTERNFIFLNDLEQPFYVEKRLIPLCRADGTIPEPNEKTVNSIYYSENYFQGEDNKPIKNVINDKSTIEELFQALDSGTKMSKYDLSSLKDANIDIICTSDNVPGASFSLAILKKGEKIMCGNPGQGYFEISQKLLEKMAGHTFDFEELLGSE
jgi:hypothetical protein